MASGPVSPWRSSVGVEWLPPRSQAALDGGLCAAQAIPLHLQDVHQVMETELQLPIQE